MDGRNLVLFFDGTSNQPERGYTNVVRLYSFARRDDRQLLYYMPGLGTMGSRATVTRMGRGMTKVAGLTLGYGIRENLEKSYRWLAANYRYGDRIYAFGFSRGAFTARALTGLVRSVGLLDPGAVELAPYVVKLYTMNPRRLSASPNDMATHGAYWRLDAARRGAYLPFANRQMRSPFEVQVHFLGLWDSVNSVRWFDARGRLNVARWLNTRKLPTVDVIREALCAGRKASAVQRDAAG
ncbi:T6SS phospholipase effector Tle1-like catalytic domain-containing protein [Mycolicibacterium helvum]|uniref:T6SS Phospholipase effector Tle1-like catalytic domain-containing protein n=1 Tax=Mycolicibacterium helvum TaxID=1534349 RepID=A0A7I7T950_9MYCO|nr:DUF2235 domain-containing protein [Mycolicibacterium helvum]BBY65021.1 hypothetical protein MHEL_32640 [Mycolicibacterium helvum]